MNELSQDDLITVVVFSCLELLGALAMLGAAFSLLRTTLRVRRLTLVAGTVVRHEPYVTSMTSSSGHGSSRVTLLRPIVRFVGSNGAPRELAHPVGASVPLPIGTEVRVGIDPARPEHAEVVSLLANYLAPTVILLSVGLVMVILIGVEISVLGR